MKSVLRIICLLLLLVPSRSDAQRNYPLNRQWTLDAERILAHPISAPVDLTGRDSTASEKLNDKYFDNFTLDYNSCFKPYIVSVRYGEKNKMRSLLYRKTKQESFFIINDTADKFHCTIDPLMNFEFGKDKYDLTNRKLSNNTRGIFLRGSIGKKFSFESYIYENQSFLPGYLDSFARRSQVIPGQGRWKDFKKTGFDYAMSGGYVSYSPSRHFNFQGGTGKHFIGDGYRSLLLSDNSFNYPYLRITTTFGRFQYTNLYTSFMNLTVSTARIPYGTEHLYEKKFANFQFLSIRIHPRIQFSLFQALICQAADSSNKQHLDFYYYNPVIGVSAIHYGMGDPNHILLGATLKIKVCNYFTLYGQYMADDFSQTGGGGFRNKQGFQAGIKLFDLFKIKNLHLQLEYNQVRPYSYSSKVIAQNYTHYNEALAHPLGANFREGLLILNYKVKDFFVELKYIHAQMGVDTSGRNLGRNLFSSDLSSSSGGSYYGINSNSNTLLQGIKSNLDIYDLKIGYLINPAYNLNIVAGVMFREFKNNYTDNKTNYIYVGIRTSLTNIYYDF